MFTSSPGFLMLPIRICCRGLLFVLLALLAACARSTSTTPAVKSAGYDLAAVPGGYLEYRSIGRGEPVLLIHGAVFADVFRPMLGDPELRSYRLIIYNRRGYGGSSRVQAPFSIAQQAADAFALLDRLGLRRVHVAGHSLGGAVALEMARQNPGRIASLVLLEAAVPRLGARDPEVAIALREAMQFYRRGDARLAVMRFSNAVSPGSWDALTESGSTAMQEQAVRDAPTFFDVEMPALTEWPFTEEDAARIDVPAVVVFGAESNRSARNAQQRLQSSLPRAEGFEVFGAGHELQMKQPHAVAAALNAFISKHR